MSKINVVVWMPEREVEEVVKAARRDNRTFSSWMRNACLNWRGRPTPAKGKGICAPQNFRVEKKEKKSFIERAEKLRMTLSRVDSERRVVVAMSASDLEPWMKDREFLIETQDRLCRLLDTRGRPIMTPDQAHDLLGPVALKIGFVEWARTRDEMERYERAIRHRLF